VSATPALRIYAVICAAIGILPVANWLTAGRAVPWYAGAVSEWLTRGFIVLGVAVTLTILLGARVDIALQRVQSRLLAIPSRTFALAVAAIAAGSALFLAHWSFAGLPFTSDEMAQQWHARILASGHFAAVAEQHPEFFNTAPVFDRDGRWYSQYPIGAVAFIALGVLVDAAWLVNPLLLGIATWMLYRLLADAFDETTARVTSLLWIASPMVLIMSASQMNHVPAMAFTLVALRFLAAWDRATNARVRLTSAATIGLAVGVAATVRPLDAAVVAAAIGAFQLWRAGAASSDARAELARSLALQCLCATVPVAILFAANVATTGHATRFAYEALNGPEHSIGFHVDPNGVMHTPTRGLVYASGYLLRLSLYLLEWPIPGMVFVVLGLAALRQASRWDVLLAGLSAGILLAYAAYWFDGFFSGPRFLFTAIPAFVYFAARSTRAIPMIGNAPARRAASLLVPLCVATAWLVPAGVSSASGRAALYREQRTKLKTDVDAQIERAGISNALVFVEESWRGRLLARLRVLGLSQFRAERVVNGVDACALQTALDAEDTLAQTGVGRRADRVVSRAIAFGEARAVAGLDADRAIALVPGSTPTPACLAEAERDGAGTIPYAIFLARQHVERDGRIGGDVVFARDLGARNELLRPRFGDRTWYRYRTPVSLSDTLGAFLPYLP
jgi:hypothetical protein